MKTIKEYRSQLVKLKASMVQNIKQEYLEGKTLKEIGKKFGVTRRIFYLWVPLTEEEKDIHLAKVKELKKMGTPRGKRKRKTKIKNVQATEYET
jgi:DNA invertase Pin-like site-specific DNA recombinase